MLVDEAPRDTHDWIFEIKFDGYRMLARVESGAIQLVTRNGNDWTSRLPGLVKAMRAMDLPDGWYDGEIIMPGADVPADFQALQNAFDSAACASVILPSASSWARRTTMHWLAVTLASIFARSSWTSWNDPIGFPNCKRCCAYLRAFSYAPIWQPVISHAEP